MIPTEHEGTVAVDAAARAAFERTRRDSTEFDDLEPLARNMWRETVLPLVWAALEALPDRAEAERERIAQAIEARAELWGDPHRGFCIPDLARVAREARP